MDCQALYDSYINDLSDFIIMNKQKNLTIEKLLALNVIYVAKNKDFSFRVVGELKYKKKTDEGKLLVAYKSVQVFNFSKKRLDQSKNIEIRSIYSDCNVLVKKFNQVKAVEKLMEAEKHIYDTDPEIEDIFGD